MGIPTGHLLGGGKKEFNVFQKPAGMMDGSGGEIMH